MGDIQFAAGLVDFITLNVSFLLLIRFNLYCIFGCYFYIISLV